VYGTIPSSTSRFLTCKTWRNEITSHAVLLPAYSLARCHCARPAVGDSNSIYCSPVRVTSSLGILWDFIAIGGADRGADRVSSRPQVIRTSSKWRITTPYHPFDSALKIPPLPQVTPFQDNGLTDAPVDAPNENCTNTIHKSAAWCSPMSKATLVRILGEERHHVESMEHIELMGPYIYRDLQKCFKAGCRSPASLRRTLA
jgi:hypothetical protein